MERKKKMSKNNDKKIMWYTLAFMAFSGVWGFGNVINGFSEYNGLKAIVAWLIIFAIYFVPYALMVGELGSAFRDHGGGVSSWIHETILDCSYALYFSKAKWFYDCIKLGYISR